MEREWRDTNGRINWGERKKGKGRNVKSKER